MKICILTERMRLGFGVDLVVDEQATRLAKRGFDVVVAVIHADFVQPERDYELVVLNKIMSVGDYGTEDWMRRILARARITDVDLWMLHTPPFYDWAPWLDGPVIITEYGTPPGHFFAPELGRHVDTAAENRLKGLYGRLRPYDSIASISRSIHKWLPRTVQPVSTVIHLGGDHFPTVRTEDADQLRSSLGISPDECLILWVGRMQLENDEQPYKGFQDLLRLIPQVQEQVPTAKFLLVGRISAGDESRLKARGLSVLANRTAEEMACAYAAADVLLNLSKWEGFNLALLEAQFQGTPVVAYDFGPHSEIVRRDETGLLAKTPKDLLRAVVTIAQNSELRRRLAAQARPFASKFTWDRNVAELEVLIRSTLARSPRRRQVGSFETSAVSGADRSLGDKVAMVARARLIDVLRFGEQALPTINQWTKTVLAKLGSFRSDASSPWFRLRDDEFVRQAYRALLGREAEVQAVEAWGSHLRSGKSRAALLTEIRHSEEGKDRPLSDPILRRIISTEESRRSGVEVPRAVVARQQLDDAAVPILRSAGRQNARAGDVRMWPTAVDRLADGEALSIAFGGTRAPDMAGTPLGPNHVMLVAPGTRLDPGAAGSLMQAAAATGSDIVFGDAIERRNDESEPRLRVYGPFSQEAFLADPDIGGVIAVHRTLLSRLGLPSTVVLTGRILLLLTAHAYSLTHVAAVLCHRDSEDVASNRPEPADTTAYADRFQADVILSDGMPGDNAPTAEVMDPAERSWKAAIVIVTQGRPCDHDSWIADLDAHASRGQFHLIRIDVPKHDANLHLASSSGDRRSTAPSHPEGSYGRIVNEAVRAAPAECDLVVVMDGDVAPTTPDWLEQLAKSALRAQAGVVAPKTLYRDGRIRHAGMAFGLGEVCSYISRFQPARPAPDDSDGSIRLDRLREVSVVSRHCMMFRRRVFLELGGFDEQLGFDAVDVDFCLRLRSAGFSVLLDGRIALTSSDQPPRWGRRPSTSDLLTLLERYQRQIVEPDEYWLPKRTADNTTAAGFRTRTKPFLRVHSDAVDLPFTSG